MRKRCLQELWGEEKSRQLHESQLLAFYQDSDFMIRRWHVRRLETFLTFDLWQLLTQDSWSWNQNTFTAFKKLFKIFKDLGATLGCGTHIVNKPLTLHWFWETKQSQFKMTFTAHCINTAELILMENSPKDRWVWLIHQWGRRVHRGQTLTSSV